MSLSAAGRTATTTLAGGAYEMWLQGSEVTAVIVAFCAVVAPALLRRVPARGAARGAAPAGAAVVGGTLMRWADRLRPWSMNEVLLLGILVALTKIAAARDRDPGHRRCSQSARWCCSCRGSRARSIRARCGSASRGLSP